MRKQNVYVINETLEIINNGYYISGTKNVPLKLNRERMEKVYVYLPKEVETLTPAAAANADTGTSPCVFCCKNIDSFSMARKILALPGGDGKVLVLNLASPVNPGGGVRRGSTAQEEDLCRKSTLLACLESEAASKYYRYNRSLHSMLGSDGIMITPEAEVFRDADNSLLNESFIVSVMTCAAPNLRQGLTISQSEYEALLLKRITGMLKAAAHHGYRHLVLGAFGCGAYKNDARTVARIFKKAMDNFNFGNADINQYFNTISFAVLDKTRDKYNFSTFYRYFGRV